jgi:hypothetical protein
VTALTCQWLMGTCTVNSVDLPDGTSSRSGVRIGPSQFFYLTITGNAFKRINLFINII